MQPMYNTKYSGHLSFFSKACILFILFQVVSCKCGNNPIKDGNEAEGGLDTTQQPPQNKPTLTLTGPAEVKAGPNTINLELEATNGTWNISTYTLKAKDLNSYFNDDYTDPIFSDDGWTKVSGIDGEKLQVLTGAATLNKGDKKTLSIPVTWTIATYTSGPKTGQQVIYSESAEFQFTILDKAGNTVAGPIEVKWTCAP